MALHFMKKDGYARKKVVGTLRRNQLITTFGSGSIVNMPEYSVMIAATNYWKEGPILHERNLEKLLKVSHFKQPYISENTESDYKPDIPAFRFPIMHFCPECGRLMPYWGFGDETGRVCTKCKKNIVPSRFVAACVNGHIEDFPYNWWVHDGDFSDCPKTGKEDALEISFSDESGGLESIVIKCTRCGKTRTMAGSMGKDSLKGYHCRGKRPWIGINEKHNDSVACTATMRGLQRGASNVYFSQTVSALTIPPWSSKLNQEIEMKWEALTEILADKPSTEALKTAIRGMFYEMLRLGKYTVDNIIEEIKKRAENKEKEYTIRDLYEDEYQMFGLRNYEQKDDYQFRIESTTISTFLDDYLEDVILVKRLREVMVLRGFRRINPEKPSVSNMEFDGYNREFDCVPLSDGPLNWYPGIEMLGEGIFIRLKEEVLAQWEKKYEVHYQAMGQRLEVSNVECENFSSRYVLLHTLSHLLIRQFTLECGYSGAAIKERIYSTYPNSTCKMAGILLYTSSSDSDGSLGGLVRNGLSENFERIFRNMLQEASWCSSDPVCVVSKAQGYDSLNYAACHACTLLPETSCERRNCLLDRCSVVGNIFDREQGYFGKLLV